MKILLADDNLPSRELMREILEASGHHIMEAFNGRDALDLIRQNRPDLVFLDLQMPVMDGFRCHSGVAKRYSFPPITGGRRNR